MTPTADSMLLHYRLAEKIGEGGMGVVWKAHDTSLGRDVAIKFLPEAFCRDAERLARFEREARLLASLNHPGIAGIFGLHEADGQRFLAMEYVPGEDLLAVLRRGPLPLDEALGVARQVADALEAAHDQGVIHRDLKPGNIRITPQGKVKILDLGLAKAFDPTGAPVSSASASLSPTVTSLGTVAGVIIGTAAYMSPEQARGKGVDRRADLWAFGCVLYEMLAGRQTFSGETVTDVLAAVVMRDPDWSLLPAATPPRVRRLLERCLRKDPARRLRHAGDAALVIEETLSGATEAETLPAKPAAASPRLSAVLPWAIAGLSIAAALAALLWRPAPPPALLGAPVALSARIPDGTLLPITDERQILALSPDGSKIAFIASDGTVARLYVRNLALSKAVAIAGTEGASDPFFSPDGEWIGYYNNGRLMKVSVKGGTPITILANLGLSRGATWTPDGTIIFMRDAISGLWKVPSSGGRPEELTKLDAAQNERTHRWPAVMPDGDHVLFTVGTFAHPGDYEESTIDAVSLKTGQRVRVYDGASYARPGPQGRILLSRGGSVISAACDPATLAIQGTPDSVLSGVEGEVPSGVVYMDIARNGTIAYVEGPDASEKYEMIWIARNGTIEPLAFPPGDYRLPRLSPDGTKVVMMVGAGRGAPSDVWVQDLRAGTMSRLTFNGTGGPAAWSADGSQIVFGGTTEGRAFIAARRGDGAGEVKELADLGRVPSASINFWTPDGARIIFTQQSAATRADLLSLVPGQPKPTPFIAGDAFEMAGDLSPDGHWLAYTVNLTGTPEVYVEAFPVSKGKWQVSAEGGMPRWSRRGDEIYFVRGMQMMAAKVRTGDTFVAEPATPLFAFPAGAEPIIEMSTPYDVAPDGRFLMARRKGVVVNDRYINVVLPGRS